MSTAHATQSQRWPLRGRGVRVCVGDPQRRAADAACKTSGSPGARHPIPPSAATATRFEGRGRKARRYGPQLAVTKSPGVGPMGCMATRRRGPTGDQNRLRYLSIKCSSVQRLSMAWRSDLSKAARALSSSVSSVVSPQPSPSLNWGCGFASSAGRVIGRGAFSSGLKPLI